MRAGNAREAEKTKCRSPTRFLSSAGLPVFAGLFAQFRTLCQKQGVSSNGERTNVIPGDFLASSKVTAWFFFPWKSAPSARALPLSLSLSLSSGTAAWCSQSRAHSLWMVLARRDVQPFPREMGSLPPAQRWEVFLGGELT